MVELIKRPGCDAACAKNILVIGVFHGDEEQGEYLINKYIEVSGSFGLENLGAPNIGAKGLNTQGAGFNTADAANAIQNRVQKNNLYYIPRLNSAKTRTNQNGVDLNRNFPTKNWGEDTSAAGANAADYYGGPFAASEEETKFIVSLMEKVRFDAILTLHAPYKIINYDGDKNGEALRLAKIVSKFTGYPVEADIGYPTPGSFGTYAGVERDIPTITIEVDENVPLGSLYLNIEGLFRFLEFEY